MRHLFYLLTLALTACTDLSPQMRWQHADTLTQAASWHKLYLDAEPFQLAAYVPNQPANSDTLTIYIEGDGLAWLSRTRPSPDPTPRDPLALRLAMRHTPGDAVYLARPCQYAAPDAARECSARYWTSHRFAPEVIVATDHAISKLKQRYHAHSLVLVGYSGGGAVAALVAARRQDVTHLITVAGNLDTDAWTALHHTTPLTGSLNPADDWQALQTLRQTHFIGTTDNNITSAVFTAYAAHFPHEHQPRAIKVEGFDHHCCWVAQWPALYSQAIASSPR